MLRYRLSQVVLCSALTIAAGMGCRKEQTSTAPPASPPQDLQQTAILPHLEGPVVQGKNYVYCATFQLAWNGLQDGVLGEPIALAGSPPMASDLAAGSDITPEVLPPGSHLVKAGWVKDGVVEQIRGEMQRRFPAATFNLPAGAQQQAAVAFAYLQQWLAFRESFDRLEEPLEFQTAAGVVEVPCFGVRHLNRQSERAIALGDQVRVLDYINDDDFILRLVTTSEDDELILAKVPPGETLAATLAAVVQRTKQPSKERGSPQLEDGESLAVPIVDLNVERRYAELEGRRFANPLHKDLFLDVALQAIRFRLDENGARVESSADLGLKSDYSKRQPREFVFDRPFLVCLKRSTSEQPYLAIWIENEELLEAAEAGGKPGA